MFSCALPGVERLSESDRRTINDTLKKSEGPGLSKDDRLEGALRLPTEGPASLYHLSPA